MDSEAKKGSPGLYQLGQFVTLTVTRHSARNLTNTLRRMWFGCYADLPPDGELLAHGPCD
jgi:hypothetical protein